MLSPPALQPRRSIIPWLFPLGLALVVAVNAGLLWFALRTFPGTVERNAYETGRQYNRLLQADAQREHRGWQVEISLSPADASIEARYRRADGTPIEGLAPRLAARRPVGDPVVLSLPMQRVAAGLYRARPDWPHRGLWQLQLQAESPTGLDERAFRVKIP